MVYFIVQFRTPEGCELTALHAHGHASNSFFKVFFTSIFKVFQISKVPSKARKSPPQVEKFRIKNSFLDKFLKDIICEIQCFSRPLGHFQVLFAEFRLFSRLNLKDLDFQGFSRFQGSLCTMF